MNIQFIGPALKADDGGILYLTHVNGKEINCHFTYEAIEDIESDSLQADPVQQFEAHKLKLLSIAEDKISKGHISNGVVSIFTHDIPL
jgi:peroxiredoxin family protein